MSHGPCSRDPVSASKGSNSLPSCPECRHTFPSVAELKLHVRGYHPVLMESPWWKDLVADDVAPITNPLNAKNIREAMRGSQGASRHSSSSSDDNSMKLNTGEESRSQSTRSKQVSFQGPVAPFEKLSLSRAKETVDPGRNQQATAPSNPRKRSANDFGTPAFEQAAARGKNCRSGTQPEPGYSELGENTRGSRRHGIPKREKLTVHVQQANALPAQGSAFTYENQTQVYVGQPPLIGQPPLSNDNQQMIQQYDTRNPTEETCLLQAECRPISLEQLIIEVKGIYAGLVMVEAKCIDVDDKQIVAAQEKNLTKRTKLTTEQWSALIALHKTLLHEHHDFFLASQHPVASLALSKLAAKYSMPARMWRHGIHAFLEVLRHRLPESLDHMLAFIYIAYSMMALLYETVPSFEDTWIECLGDLGRYRMAIEDDDIRDREVWSGVARFWYRKAADKSPKIGRLYHHLAILARPYTILQLYFYTRSLTCISPFDSARGSILTLFVPVLENNESVIQRSNAIEIKFIRAHALLFTGGSQQDYHRVVRDLILDGLFDQYITRANSKFKEIGVYTAQSNIAAVLGYGALTAKGTPQSILRVILDQKRFQRIAAAKNSKEEIPHADQAEETQKDQAIPTLQDLTVEERDRSEGSLKDALLLFHGALAIILRRKDDKNGFPMIHVYLVFIWFIASIPEAMKYLESAVPWAELVSFLNNLASTCTTAFKLLNSSFPSIPSRPLPEDYSMRGGLYSETWFPSKWFENAGLDDEERALELPSMHAPRVDRIRYAGYGIAMHDKWIRLDAKSNHFTETAYAKELARDRSKLAPEMPIVKDEDSSMVGADEARAPLKREVHSPETSTASIDTPQKESYESESLQEMELDARGSRPQQMGEEEEIKRESSSPPAYQSSITTDQWLKMESLGQKPISKVDSGEIHVDSGQPVIFNVLDEKKDPTKV